MQEQLFQLKMITAKRLGITIASPQHVFKDVGFIGIYRHPMEKMRDTDDAIILVIADELIAMQSASRLMIGKLFFASMNIRDGKMVAEIFCDLQFAGEEHLKEINEKFVALMRRFTEWVIEGCE